MTTGRRCLLFPNGSSLSLWYHAELYLNKNSGRNKDNRPGQELLYRTKPFAANLDTESVANTFKVFSHAPTDEYFSTGGTTTRIMNKSAVLQKGRKSVFETSDHSSFTPSFDGIPGGEHYVAAVQNKVLMARDQKNKDKLQALENARRNYAQEVVIRFSVSVVCTEIYGVGRVPVQVPTKRTPPRQAARAGLLTPRRRASDPGLRDAYTLLDGHDAAEILTTYYPLRKPENGDRKKQTLPFTEAETASLELEAGAGVWEPGEEAFALGAGGTAFDAGGSSARRAVTTSRPRARSLPPARIGSRGSAPSSRQHSFGTTSMPPKAGSPVAPTSGATAAASSGGDVYTRRTAFDATEGNFFVQAIPFYDPTGRLDQGGNYPKLPGDFEPATACMMMPRQVRLRLAPFAVTEEEEASGALPTKDEAMRWIRFQDQPALQGTKSEMSQAWLRWWVRQQMIRKHKELVALTTRSGHVKTPQCGVCMSHKRFMHILLTTQDNSRARLSGNSPSTERDIYLNHGVPRTWLQHPSQDVDRAPAQLVRTAQEAEAQNKPHQACSVQTSMKIPFQGLNVQQNPTLFCEECVESIMNTEGTLESTSNPGLKLHPITKKPINATLPFVPPVAPTTSGALKTSSKGKKGTAAKKSKKLAATETAAPKSEWDLTMRVLPMHMNAMRAAWEIELQVLSLEAQLSMDSWCWRAEEHILREHHDWVKCSRRMVFRDDRLPLTHTLVAFQRDAMEKRKLPKAHVEPLYMCKAVDLENDKKKSTLTKIQKAVTSSPMKAFKAVKTAAKMVAKAAQGKPSKAARRRAASCRAHGSTSGATSSSSSSGPFAAAAPYCVHKKVRAGSIPTDTDTLRPCRVLRIAEEVNATRKHKKGKELYHVMFYDNDYDPYFYDLRETGVSVTQELHHARLRVPHSSFVHSENFAADVLMGNKSTAEASAGQALVPTASISYEFFKTQKQEHYPFAVQLAEVEERKKPSKFGLGPPTFLMQQGSSSSAAAAAAAALSGRNAHRDGVVRGFARALVLAGAVPLLFAEEAAKQGRRGYVLFRRRGGRGRSSSRGRGSGYDHVLRRTGVDDAVRRFALLCSVALSERRIRGAFCGRHGCTTQRTKSAGNAAAAPERPRRPILFRSAAGASGCRRWRRDDRSSTHHRGARGTTSDDASRGLYRLSHCSRKRTARIRTAAGATRWYEHQCGSQQVGSCTSFTNPSIPTY
ncbi:unnamed protein product [Amoebophrya sp. A120]|nr:unnamed protein product [Amoebophrya sp. A120]|eukprot:GSA120T00012907001.1